MTDKPSIISIVFQDQLANLRPAEQYICLVCHQIHHLSSKPPDLGNLTQLLDLISDLTTIPCEELPFKDDRFGLCPFCYFDKIQKLIQSRDTMCETKKVYQKLSSDFCLAIVKSRNLVSDIVEPEDDLMDNFKRWNNERLKSIYLKDLTDLGSSDIEDKEKDKSEFLKPKRRTRSGRKRKSELVLLAQDQQLQLQETQQQQLIQQETEIESQIIYKCTFCDTFYMNENDLRIHEKIHIELQPSTSSGLPPSASIPVPIPTQKSKSSGKTQTYQCTICKKSYTRSYSLKIHLAETHKIGVDKDKIHKCRSCKKTFASAKALANHKKSHEKLRRDLLTCPICKKILSQKRGLEAHIHGHHQRDFNIESVHCETCQKVFEDPIILLNHLDMHKGENKCEIECCKKAFKSKSLLKTHSKVHVANSIWIDCDFCTTIFDDKEVYGEHLKGHLEKKSFLCQTCGKTMPSQTLLAAHARLHREPSFICQFCDKKFYSSSNLKSHARLHTGEKPFKCPVPDCNESFTQKASLNAHMRKHSGVMPFSCQYCDHEGFSYKLGLRQHMGTKHADIYLATKKFVCDVCWKNFFEEHQLEEHKVIHLKHKCQICSRQFKMLNHLKEHLLRHAEIKPHKCSHCDKAYYRKKALVDHIKKAHPTQDPSACLEPSVTYIVEIQQTPTTTTTSTTTVTTTQ